MDHVDEAVHAATSPVLVIAQANDPQVASDAMNHAGFPADSSDVKDRATAIALRSITPLARLGVEHALDTLVARLEARMNPFGNDLEDGAPEAQLVAIARASSARLGASDALASGRRASADGKMIVAIAAECPRTASVAISCAPLWSKDPPTEHDDVARARFFAWPLAAAGVVAAGDASAADAIASTLRALSLTKGTTIALVLTARDLEGEDARVDAIRARAKDALAIARRDPKADVHLLELLARESPRTSALPWLTLAPNEILVVPQMIASAETSAMSEEITNALRSQGPVKWSHRAIGWR
jgi:hypothetical protein